MKEVKRVSFADEQKLKMAGLSYNDYAQEAYYTRTKKLPGFVPWDRWVPMPYPHRELTYARCMYHRGENLIVQTPDFVDFANDLADISS